MEFSTTMQEKKTNNEWFETQDSINYWDDFNKPKIFYREISDEMNAAYAKEPIYINNKAYIITGNHLIYILCYLNSSVFNKVILRFANSTGGKGPEFLLSQNLFKPSASQEEYVINLFDRLHDIQELTGKNKIEAQINDFFFSIYGLTSEERMFIETSNSQ